MCNIKSLFHSLEVADFVPLSFYRVAALTVLLQCELYFLIFHIEKWRDIMAFSGLLSVQHPYCEVFVWLVCALFEFTFCLTFSRNCVWNCSVIVYLSKITLHIVGRHNKAPWSFLLLIGLLLLGCSHLGLDFHQYIPLKFYYQSVHDLPYWEWNYHWWFVYTLKKTY